MKDRKLRLTALALVLTLLLTACGRDSTLPTPDISAGELPGEKLGIAEAADAVFSLNYSSSESLNPYATNDTSNILISQLVFDNVFELDDDYNLSSRIIADYSVTNGTG